MRPFRKFVACLFAASSAAALATAGLAAPLAHAGRWLPFGIAATTAVAFAVYFALSVRPARETA